MYCFAENKFNLKSPKQSQANISHWHKLFQAIYTSQNIFSEPGLGMEYCVHT